MMLDQRQKEVSQRISKLGFICNWSRVVSKIFLYVFTGDPFSTNYIRLEITHIGLKMGGPLPDFESEIDPSEVFNPVLLDVCEVYYKQRSVKRAEDFSF